MDFESRDPVISAALTDRSAVADRRVPASMTSRSDRRYSADSRVTEPRCASALPSVPATLNLEPLQPARLRPAKEKANLDSKQLESGEAVSKQRGDVVNDDGVDNASDASTPSDSYQTPGGSPQHEAVLPPTRLTYDMTASSGLEPSRSYVIHSENGSWNDTDSNKLHGRSTDKTVLQSALKLDSERTSFANLRKWKERNSGSTDSPMIYDQQAGPSTTMSKSVYVVPPAQTTWMEAARLQRSASERQVCRPVGEVADGGLAPSQMAGLKMKLEEKRRVIQSGKRRAEQQRSLQQQQVGNEAFMQMIRRRDRQPVVPLDGNSPQKNNASPLAGSNVRSASAGRCGTFADGSGSNAAIVRHPAVNKDATIVMPSKGVTQPVLSGAMLSKNRDSTKIANSQIRAPSLPSQPATAATQRRSQVNNVVDAGPQGSKYQDQAVTADKADHLEPPQGMSFDRLSSSLSDLQAEIVRLTQQQDEIKHLVSGNANGATAAAEHVPFFLYPTSGHSVSAAPNAVQATSSGTAIPPSTRPPQAYPPPAGYPVDPRLYVPEYGTFPPHYSSHHHHIASSLPPAGAMYPMSAVPPMGHRYPGGGPFMTPYPHDPMSGIYRSPGMPPTAASDVYSMHWHPGHQPPQPYYMSSPYVDHSRRDVPDSSLTSHSAPSVPPHAVSMPGHSSREPAVTGSVSAPLQSVQGEVAVSQPSSFFISTSSVSEPIVVTSASEVQYPVATVSSPAAAPATPVSQATAFFVDTSTVADTSPELRASPSAMASPVPVSTPHATAFFVSALPSVDSLPPADSQEQRSSESEVEHHRDNDDVAFVSTTSDLQTFMTEEPSSSTPAAAVSPAADEASSSEVSSSSPADAKMPVVFVIGQDEEVRQFIVYLSINN